MTLSVRIPFSLAERSDAARQGAETTSDIVRVALDREVAKRERRRLAGTAA